MPWWIWASTFAGIAVLLAADTLYARRPHKVEIKEAVAWSAIYLGIAVAFGVCLYLLAPGDAGSTFFAGYLIERILSIDNLFVFAVVLNQFAVPEPYRQRALLIGVAAALALRAGFIAAGSAMVQRFTVSFVAFGVLLICSAVHLVRSHDKIPELSETRIIRVLRRVIPVTTDYRSHRLLTSAEGRISATPMFLVAATILTVDLVFAMDSIPAIFGITQNTYVVFTANAIALLGLRPLYFLIAGLLDRVAHLHYGLAVILGFIGVKLVLHFAHTIEAAVPEISTGISLVVILAVLGVTGVSSAFARKHTSKRDAARQHETNRQDPHGRHAPGTHRIPAPVP